jgi:putative nucleotidyltransferase with HDIG domain
MKGEILVVDDDAKVLEILSESLRRKGYRVRHAANGQQAIDSFEQQPPELVLLDMMLPDMNGLEVLKQFRERVGDRIPVVFLSANGDLSVRLESLDNGAEDYLVKPVPLRELGAKVNNILSRSTRTRALQAKSNSLQTQITRRREQHDKISKRFQRQMLSMRTLFDVSQDLSRLNAPEDLVNVVSLTLLGELQISSMAMFTLEKEQDDVFKLLGVKGFSLEKFDGITVGRRGNFVQMVEKVKKPVKIARNTDRRWMQELPDLRLAAFEYVTPLIVRGDTKGLVFTGPKISVEEYSEHDKHLLSFVANSAGIGLENARMFKQLQMTYVSTLKTLISIIEAKDPYTRGHTERVASYSNAIAARLDLSEEKRRRIMFGALLHDIGKVGVLENVLHKEGSLDKEEWELLQEHPAVGARIVEKMEFLVGVSEIVRHHHESWDGRGYPEGLMGESIPLGARIVTVADSFDAMTTDRSYRRALSMDEAIERLEAASGTQFDPWIVRVFVKFVRHKGTELILPGTEENEQS